MDGFLRPVFALPLTLIERIRRRYSIGFPLTSAFPGATIYPGSVAATDPVVNVRLNAVQPGPSNGPRIALVHDWLVDVRGGERVFQRICEAFPEGDIFTLIYDRDRMPEIFRQRGVRSSFIQLLPYAAHYRRVCLPLYPFAARRLDLTKYDLVIASSSAWASGVKVSPHARLICYCHTPFRYAWSHYESLVLGRLPAFGRLTDALRSWVQKWDLESAGRVDLYIANSRVVQQRIAAYYGRESAIVPPPIDLRLFTPTGAPTADYFLIVSALMRYKRVDIAVDAFSQMGLQLKVVGDGEEAGLLRRMAGPSVQFLGRLPDAKIADLYANCRAFVFTADEDFGITPLEAMASGRPVIAYRAGGALETVVGGRTGVFFDCQSPESLAEVIRATDFSAFNPVEIRNHAEQFGVPAFTENLHREVDRCMRGTCLA